MKLIPLLALSILVGCSAAETPPPRESSPVIEIPDAQRFESIDEIVAALEEGGVQLGEAVSSRPGPNQDALKDFRDYSWPEVGSNVSIWLFENKKDRDQWLPQMTSTLRPVYSHNWIVISAQRPEAIWGALGGTLDS